MPDVTPERQVYPNCNLNATKVKESMVSVTKVASNKSFFKYSFCVYKHGFKFQRWFKHVLLISKQVKNLYKWTSIR